MQSTIAPYLLSTYQMIKRAFPNGIEPEAYLPLLAILDDELSDRNLAQIMAHYTGKDYATVLNDVYRITSTAIPIPEAIAKVKQRLLVCGYEEWLHE
jgi:diketogulonate reductase-like aldo/keto reductase